MITIKEVFVEQNLSTILVYHDNVSVIQTIAKDFSFDLSIQKDLAKIDALYQTFFEEFIRIFLDECNDEECDKFEFIIDNLTFPGNKEKYIEFLERSQHNIEEIYHRAYYEFKKKQ